MALIVQRLDGLLHALLYGINDVVQAQAFAQVLFRCVAHFAVDHAVGGEVLDEFAGHTDQRLTRLHDRKGVFEGF